MVTDAQLEQEIQAKGLTAPRITPADVEEVIAHEFYFSASDGLIGNPDAPCVTKEEIFLALDQVTICSLVLKNGHKIIGVNEGPVDPKNFDAEIAKKLARQKAIDQVWGFLGYQLKEKLANGG